MYSNEIVKTLNVNNLTKMHFKGIFACDKLPMKAVLKPSFYIANTDPSYKPGQHWVAFYFPRNEPAEYFCSLGQPPIKPFKLFLKRNSKFFLYNKRQIQHPSSNLCGLYCCVFIYLRSKNISFTEILNLFNYYNLYENDVIILTLFKYIFF